MYVSLFRGRPHVCLAFYTIFLSFQKAEIKGKEKKKEWQHQEASFIVETLIKADIGEKEVKVTL